MTAYSASWTQTTDMYHLTISKTFKCPDENTIALGGVATGSMKANDAAMVAGIIKYRGFRLAPTATSDKIGRNKVVVATFAVTSVTKATTVDTTMATAGAESPPRDLNVLLISSDRPDTYTPKPASLIYTSMYTFTNKVYFTALCHCKATSHQHYYSPWEIFLNRFPVQ
jgi:hypothetical protein